MIEGSLHEWEEYDSRMGEDMPVTQTTMAGKQWESESLEPSMESSHASESPFLLTHEGEMRTAGEGFGMMETEAEEYETATETPEFETQVSPETFTTKFGHEQERGLDEASEGSFGEAELEFDPYASIRPAMAPEHANLSANELTVVLGRRPATLVLHQLVNSPQMRQATLASLLGRSARRSVRVNGLDLPIPAYLRLVSRLCREVAEHNEAEARDGMSYGETAEQESMGQTLSGSVGRGGTNRADDVRLVQRLINANLPIPLAPLTEDGVIGPKTIFAIETYQRRNLRVNPPDGRVDPGGVTFRSLMGGGTVPPPAPRPSPTPSTPAGTFPPDIIAAAQASHTTWKIPASVTLAQWAIESNWGRAMPKGSNNPFGIKAVGNQPYVEAHTREVINGKDVTIVARFRAFDSMNDAFDQHGRLLATAKPYAHARTVVDNPDAFADALTGVYATDPRYGSVLKSAMTKYNLYQYD
jgi:hypothetical protein